jgi:hypothetical protein
MYTYAYTDVHLRLHLFVPNVRQLCAERVQLSRRGAGG